MRGYHNKDNRFQANIRKHQTRLNEFCSYWKTRFYGEDGKGAAKLYVNKNRSIHVKKRDQNS